MKRVFLIGLAVVSLNEPQFCAGQQAGREPGNPPKEAPLPVFEVAQETFPPDASFEKLAFHLGQLSPNPEGILLVAGTDVRMDLFKDPDWIAFAERNKWSVLVLDIVPAKSPPPPLTLAAQRTLASQEFGKRLYAWMDAKTAAAAKGGEASSAEPPPLLIYASGDSSFWMESLMLQKPRRYSAWFMAGATRFAPVSQTEGFKYPTGCLLALQDGQHNTHLDHFEDLRADNKANLMSFARWEIKGQSPAMVDAFARLYLESAVHSPSGQHVWANVHTLAHEPAGESPPSSLEMGWFPSLEVLGASGALRPLVLPKPSPAFVRKTFSTPEFKSCELHWIANVAKPKAALLIGNSPLPTAIRHMPEWINYAKEREWAIALVSLTQAKIRSEEDALKGLEARLYSEIDSLAGPDVKNLPLVAYSQGATGGWMQALIMRQPQRYLAWATSNVTRFPAITTAIKTPPGLLIAAQDAEYRMQLHHFEDLRTADAYNPACLLPLSQPLPPPAWVNASIRSFFDGAVTAKKESHRWLHLHELTAPSRALASKQDPKTYAWFPSAEMAGMWKMLRKATELTPLPGITKRSFKTKIPEAPELKLFIRLPAGVTKGQPVGGVLCFCGWQEEDAPLVNRLKNTNDFLVRFADRNGLAMITWNAPGMVPPDALLQQRSPAEEAELDIKYAAFSEAWHDSVKKVCNEFQFRNDGMLLYGLSRGSRYVHNISMRYPKLFLAVHTHIGNNYNVPFPKEAKETLWLITTGEMDPGSAESLALYEKGVEQKLPILFKAGESLGHDIRRDIEELSAAFFANALELQKDCEKRRSKDRRITDTPAILFARQMKEPLYFGDSINHEIVVAAEVASWWVPEPQRVPLPTEAIAKAWGMPLEQAMKKAAPPSTFAVAPANAPEAQPAAQK